MYIDGDESFTKTGMESVIGNEVSMPRAKDYDFYAKFDAIDRFVKNCPVITDGEAHIIRQDEDGFVVPGVHNSLAAEALKIVINSIYGKFGIKIQC